MRYMIRKVRKQDGVRYGYDFYMSDFVMPIEADADFINVLNYLKETKSPIVLHEYNKDLGDDDEFEYVPVKIELTCFDGYYIGADYQVTVYCVDPYDNEGD